MHLTLRDRMPREAKVPHGLNGRSGSLRFLVAFMVALAIAVPIWAQSEECPISDLKKCIQRREPSADIDSPAHVKFRSYSSPISNASFADWISEALGLTTVGALCDLSNGCLDGSLLSSRTSLSVENNTETSADSDKSGDSSKSSVVSVRPREPVHPNQFFYKNKLELSLEGGWLPINIPFVFDVFLGDGYTMTNLKYTLVPLIASIRWQTGNPDGPWIFRGNWDLEASGAAVVIPRGPETHYFAFILGFRRNFVPRSGRIAPYFDGRLGMGAINAKEPLGVLYAQGQNFTFTMNMGSGIRYNINPKYALWGGLNWMHISNLYLSQPQFANYGINVYGPMFGVDVRLGKLRRHRSE